MINQPADPLDRAADAEESQRQESIKAVLSPHHSNDAQESAIE